MKAFIHAARRGDSIGYVISRHGFRIARTL